MPSQSNTKRSQPMPAKQRNRDGNSKSSSNKTPRGSPNAQTNAPVTAASSATKRVAKAVRSGAKSKSKTNKTRMEGPEAERSDDENDEEIVYPDGAAEEDDDDDDEVESGELESTTPEPDEKRVSRGERVVLGVQGKSVPNKEIGMDALLAGAKSRPESHNITRGYEFITSPASRLIIPSVELKVMGGNQRGRNRMVRHDSIASCGTAFTDDSEWEKVQFEMDASVDAFSDSESLSLSQHDIDRKKKNKSAYAEVVKRNYPVPVVAAS